MSKIEGPHLWCPIDLVIHVIGSRWTIAIVRELATGSKRPSELARALGRISAKTLTQRLRDLEEWGLVKRVAYQEIPPRVEYSLTDRGNDLLYVLEALKDLGESWQRSLNIEVPVTVKEQCSHCFEYLARNGKTVYNQAELSHLGVGVGCDGDGNGNGNGNGAGHLDGHGNGRDLKLCPKNSTTTNPIETSKN
jgi:DNA-binding HxlR family transcriptional regulator